MVLVEAAVVVSLVCVVFLGLVRLLARPQDQRRPASTPGHWRTAHYDVKGETRVVIQKVSTTGSLVDEHVVATIPVDDPDYDARFLIAMNTARERRALFESEED